MSMYDDAGDDASKYLDQIPGTISPYYQPYINAGSDSLSALGQQISALLGGGSSLNSAYGSMISNPGGYMNSIGAGYQESPGYQYQLNQGQQAVANTAASGGYVGSPQEQQYSASMTEGLANQDYYNYLDHAMKMLQGGLRGAQHQYDTGMNSLEGINKMGYDASSQLAEGLAQALTQQGNLAYASDINKNQQKGGLIGDTIGFVGSLAKDLF